MKEQIVECAKCGNLVKGSIITVGCGDVNHVLLNNFPFSFFPSKTF